MLTLSPGVLVTASGLRVLLVAAAYTYCFAFASYAEFVRADTVEHGKVKVIRWFDWWRKSCRNPGFRG
jgi:hypothetical protein